MSVWGARGCALILELSLEEESGSLLFWRLLSALQGFKGAGEMGGRLWL